MGTIADKLKYLSDTKAAIKNAISLIGGGVTDQTPFREYSNIIKTLPKNIDFISYGVKWDTTVSDPHLTRIGNALLHKELPIQSLYRGCVAKGKQIQYYLLPSDWSKKADGTPSKLDGTDGDVRIHIPRFYGKSFIEGNIKSVRISLVKVDDTWMEIPEMLVDAYRCTINNVEGKTASVVSNDVKYRGGGNRSDNDQFLATEPTKSDLGKPRTAMSRANMRNYANNAGSELLCYEYYKWIFYWSYVIEYANFNSQEAYKLTLTPEGYHQGGLGNGLTTMANWGGYNGYNPITPCGYCNEFGNFTGVKNIVIPEFTFIDKEVQKTQGQQTLQVARWRGFDNPFGDIWTNLDGVVIKRTAVKEPSNVYTTTDSTKFDDSISNKTIAGVEIAQDGYIKDITLGSRGDIIPSAVGGGSTYYCDYHYCNVDYIGDRTLLVGGCANSWSYAGFGYFHSSDGVGIVSASVGFRTLIRL